MGRDEETDSCRVLLKWAVAPANGYAVSLRGRWDPSSAGWASGVVSASRLLKEPGETVDRRPSMFARACKVKLNEVSHQVTFFALEKTKRNASVRDLLCVMIMFIPYMKT